MTRDEAYLWAEFGISNRVVIVDTRHAEPLGTPVTGDWAEFANGRGVQTMFDELEYLNGREADPRRFRIVALPPTWERPDPRLKFAGKEAPGS